MAKGRKTGGRISGTPNKTTSELKETIREILTNEVENISTYLNQLTEKERLDVIIKLLPYGIPKETDKNIPGNSQIHMPVIQILRSEKDV
jgi:hypothetical protein